KILAVKPDHPGRGIPRRGIVLRLLDAQAEEGVPLLLRRRVLVCGSQIAVHLGENAVVGRGDDATDSRDRIARTVAESRQLVGGTSSEAGLHAFELGVEVDGSKALVELAIRRLRRDQS